MDRKEYIDSVERLHTREGFERETVALLSGMTFDNDKEENMKINKKLKVIVAAAVFALLMSTTVFAAVMLLTPPQVAERLGDSQLAQAFESEDAIIVNDSIQSDEYTVTFLGMVSGRNISTIFGNSQSDLTYAAFSVEYTDGRAMNQAEGCPVSITPLVSGYAPWHVNLFTLSNGAYGYVENNVYYYLFSCSSLEYFADRDIALYVYSGQAPSSEIFSFDSDTGAISYSNQYTGARGIFELELDDSKADPQKARQLLEDAGFELNEDGSIKLE